MPQFSKTVRLCIYKCIFKMQRWLRSNEESVRLPACDAELQTVGVVHKWDKNVAFQSGRCRSWGAFQHSCPRWVGWICSANRVGNFQGLSFVLLSQGFASTSQHFLKQKYLYDFRIGMGLLQEWLNQLLIRIGIIPIALNGNVTFLFLMKGLASTCQKPARIRGPHLTLRLFQ